MASLISLLNRLLPFATPGTPLLQDLVHLASICTVLYFAPQIQEWVQQRRLQHQDTHADEEQDEVDHGDAPAEPQAAQNGFPNGHVVQEDRPEPNLGQPEGDQREADMVEDGQPGPANAAQTSSQRNVGAKKAKSLARKDQRRAYHEFQRSQGEAQRARDAEGAAEREAGAARERARRKAKEDAIAADRARERERRRIVEAQEREADNRRRDMVVEIVKEKLDRDRMVDLFKVARQVGSDVDEEWVEKILKATAGLIGRSGDVLTMITSTGWAVRVGEDDMRELYARTLQTAEGNSEGCRLEELGPVLKQILSDGTG